MKKPTDQDRVDALRILGRGCVEARSRLDQMKAAIVMPFVFVCQAVVEVHDGEVVVEEQAATREEAVRRATAKVSAQFCGNRASSLKSLRVLARWENGIWVEFPAWSEKARQKLNVQGLWRALPSHVWLNLSFADRLHLGRLAREKGCTFDWFVEAVLKSTAAFCKSKGIGIHEWIRRVLGRR